MFFNPFAGKGLFCCLGVLHDTTRLFCMFILPFCIYCILSRSIYKYLYNGIEIALKIVDPGRAVIKGKQYHFSSSQPDIIYAVSAVVTHMSAAVVVLGRAMKTAEHEPQKLQICQGCRQLAKGQLE